MTKEQLDTYAHKLAAQAVAALIPDRVTITSEEPAYSLDRPEEGAAELRGAWVGAQIWVDSREHYRGTSMLGRKPLPGPTLQAAALEALGPLHLGDGEPALPVCKALLNRMESDLLVKALGLLLESDASEEDRFQAEALRHRLASGYYGSAGEAEDLRRTQRPVGQTHPNLGQGGICAPGATDADRKEPDMEVTLRITDTPSRSKGWARAKLVNVDGPVIASNTGNEWVGGAPTYSGTAAEGDELQLTLECMLKTGQSRGTRREERTSETYQLTARSGATCTVEYRPGSQGITVEITGAELAA